ncbi:MAG: thiol:disulfide interchange protein, partial [Crocinitomicaceae bacterium]
MKISQRILVLAIALVCSVGSASAIQAKSMNNEVKAMLELVETKKDFTDALTLIEQKYQTEYTEDSEIQGLLTTLSVTHKTGLPEWTKAEAKDGSTKSNGTSPADPVDKEPVETRSLWSLFFEGIGWGFVALLTPCVFPMIPMTVSFFTKQSKTRAKGIMNALIYGVSIVVIYVALGLLITLASGSPATVYELSTNVWMNMTFFAIFMVFAFSFLGAFEIK